MLGFPQWFPEDSACFCFFFFLGKSKYIQHNYLPKEVENSKFRFKPHPHSSETFSNSYHKTGRDHGLMIHKYEWPTNSLKIKKYTFKLDTVPSIKSAD